MSALDMILAERQRQIAKGFTATHDDEDHAYGELARIVAPEPNAETRFYPFVEVRWLAALIAAEIDRMIRCGE